MFVDWMGGDGLNVVVEVYCCEWLFVFVVMVCVMCDFDFVEECV